ncbi:Oidioi.mRNA.OKI2018_I69.chr2.g4158.t1.cds [Oikopleura dioica]|uniref:Oidioi.mRNA.OKI2018_I69.chr2.g4158.t1.cds n=1 Tax=Oikopleura dioica TaxID=34765 RepID=A0ABN7SZX7_OIKDI|nr:Oidioi.mRNA.OKI2018_I69.chr2.g4158.t1.cds [Oikopleura dioica]
MDFMRAMEDGRIGITLIDSIDIYDLEHVHYKSFAKYSSIGISFDLTEVVTKDTPWKFVKGVPTKNLASDDVQIMLTGLDKVSFLTTEENCLLTGGAAYLEAREYTDLERSCLIEGKTFWSKPVLPAA